MKKIWSSHQVLNHSRQTKNEEDKGLPSDSYSLEMDKIWKIYEALIRFLIIQNGQKNEDMGLLSSFKSFKTNLRTKEV